MDNYTLPTNYNELSIRDRRLVREEYIRLQNNKCYYCGNLLTENPTEDVMNKKINTRLFPPNFFKYPVHLQHCHKTEMTEGAVHSRCNAVMWQYENK